MRFRTTISLSIFLLSVSFLFGQGNTGQIAAEFDAAVDQHDHALASRKARQLLEADPNAGWMLASGLEKLAALPKPLTGLLDTLSLAYELGAKNRPEEASEYLQKRAFLGFRFPIRFRRQQMAWLREAIRTNPLQCSLQLYQFWSDELERGKLRDRLSMGKIAREWASYDRFLYARELTYPTDAESIHRVRVNLHHKLSDLSPDCDAIAKTLKVETETSQIYPGLVLHSLKKCRKKSSWDRFAAHLDNNEGWGHRLMAYHFLDVGNTEECLAWFNRALKLEDMPILKADLHLQTALLYMRMGKYRTARSQILAAIRLAPTWGELYLGLVDVYLDGARECGFNEFDQKAVYWLAIDLCQRAINSSPHLEKEANEKIFEYRLRMPNAEEVKFRGLSAGDTWPLKCWMNTVTTVKVE